MSDSEYYDGIDDSNNDSSDSDSSDNDEPIYEIDQILCNPIYSNSIYKMYMISSNDLLKIERHWGFNRDLDIKHYVQISDDLLKMKTPFLMGSIKIVRDNYKNIKIIDGQHRIKAIKEILLNNPSFVFDVQCDVYTVNNCNYDSEITELFKMANSNLNVKKSDIPENILIETIDKLKKDYPLHIKDRTDTVKSKTGKVKRPNVTKDELYNIIKDSNIIEECNLTEIQLYNKIKEYNLQIGAHNTMIELCGDNSKTSQNVYTKAKKSNFYLGLNRRQNKLSNDWIYSIKQSLSLSLSLLKKVSKTAHF